MSVKDQRIRNMDEDLYRKMHAYAVVNDITVGEAMNRAMSFFLQHGVEYVGA